jgi:hypothetical protein
VTGKATDCDINFSFIVENNANADVTTSLSSFFSMTPTGDSSLRTFLFIVSASTNLLLKDGSPYKITAYAKLTKSMTVVSTDTLTLTVKNSCIGAFNAGVTAPV